MSALDELDIYVPLAVVDIVHSLEAENERLRAALTKANAQAERFEREWYLRGDEIEQLRADAARYRWLRDVGGYMMPPTPGVIRLDINDHIEHLSGDALDAAIDAAIGDDGSAT